MRHAIASLRKRVTNDNSGGGTIPACTFFERDYNNFDR